MISNGSSSVGFIAFISHLVQIKQGKKARKKTYCIFISHLVQIKQDSFWEKFKKDMLYIPLSSDKTKRNIAFTVDELKTLYPT